MQRVALRGERGVDGGLGFEVAAARAGGTDADGAAGQPRGHAVAVDVRDADDGLQPERAARADDPHGDLAPVGDEDALHATRNSGAPNSTSCAFSAHTSAIVPDTPARIEFIIF